MKSFQFSSIIFFLHFTVHLAATPFLKPNNATDVKALSVEFTKNNGQIIDLENKQRPDVLYTADAGGIKFYLQKNAISYVYTKSDERKDNQIKERHFAKSTKMEGYRIDVEFVGASINSNITGEDETGGYTNYYLAHCPSGITKVKSFKKITYANLYKNIDVAWIGDKANGLKYDITVNPGGNANEIKLKYSGMKKIGIEDGKLILKTRYGNLEEYIPKIFQTINGKEIIVQGGYTLQNNEVGFNIGDHNKNYPLIIDPWITYFGGNGTDWGAGIDTDSRGNVIISGSSGAANFPVTVGAFQTNFAGGNFDAFAAKFNANGNRLWATYYGGLNTDYASDVAIDPSDNIVMAGQTWSPDFPISAGAFQSIFNLSEVVVVKFDTSGLRLWGTYFGGSDHEGANGIAIDKNGDIFFTGSTASTDFPVSSGAFQTIGSGLFITKLDGNGNRLWATYCGSAVGNSIAADKNGNVAVTGYTNSTSFPVTPGCFQNSLVTATDAFIIKFDANGNRLWGSYYGGSGQETGYTVAFDTTGNILFTGITSSLDFSVTPGAYQPALNYGTGSHFDTFIVKFDPGGKRLWATFYGGSRDEFLSGIAVNELNHIYIGGMTYSLDLPVPVSSCTFQQTNKGSADQFIARFDDKGQYICSTYIGGNSTSGDGTNPNCIASRGSNIYMTGIAYGNFPVSTNAFQSTLKGLGDASIISFCGLNCGGTCPVTIDFATSYPAVCKDSLQNFTSNIASTCLSNATCNWTFNGASPSTSNVTNPTGILYGTPGTYSVKLVVQSDAGKDSVTKSITVVSCACTMTTLGTVTTNILCYGDSIGSANVSISNGSGTAYTYMWSNGFTGATQNNMAAGTYSVTVNDIFNCKSVTTVSITQPLQPLTCVLNTSYTTCGNDNGAIVANAGGGSGVYTYMWSNGQTSATISNLSIGTYSVTVTDANNCSVNSSVFLIKDSPDLLISGFSKTDVLCFGDSLGQAEVITTGGKGTLTYSWSNGQTGATAINLGSNTYTVTITDSNNCTIVSSVFITQPASAVSISVSSKTDEVCGLSDGKIQISSSGGTGSLSCLWSNGSINSTITGLSSGSYTLTVTDANNCSSITVVSIQNTGNITADAGLDATICSGSSVQLSATGGTSYQWQASSSLNNLSVFNPVASPTVTTEYIVTTSTGTCSDTDTITVFVVLPPVASASNDTSINAGNSVQLLASGGVSYLWTPGLGLSCTNCLSPIATPVNTTLYIVTVINSQGCADSDSVLINVDNTETLFVAEVFSPNNDGLNDILHVLGKNIRSVHFVIYDRWGERVFETNNMSVGWDGTYKGKDVPAGVFVYYVDADMLSGNTISKKGDVSLIR